MRLNSIEKIRSNRPIPNYDDPTLLPCQSETLNRFDDEGVASDSRTMSTTRLQYLAILRHLGLMFPKPYKEFTKEDYVIYFSQKCAPNTKISRLRIIKRFNRWLFDLPKGEYPACIAWMENPSSPGTSVTAADLLTEEEILALLRVSDVQSRARIGVLYDTAGRNAEVFYLRKKDIQETFYGFKITLRSREGSKTKRGTYGHRTVPLVNSRKYLTNWFDNHPSWHTSSNPPLWVHSFTGEELKTECGFNTRLKKIAMKAGITKNVYPHLFRHTKLTDCARTRMTESAMRKFAGWSPTSNMPATYVHLSGIEMEREALRSAGIEIPEERPMFDYEKVCPQCGIENELHATYCAVCSARLDKVEYIRGEAIKIAELMEQHEGLNEELIKLLRKTTSSN